MRRNPVSACVTHPNETEHTEQPLRCIDMRVLLLTRQG
jgi:hypothetical protein